MKFFSTIIEQLDMAIAEIAVDQPINSRLALIPIDNATELLIHRSCEQYAARGAIKDNTPLSPKMRREATGDHFEPKLVQIGERVRRERAVKDPSLIAESDLTKHRLIDSVFIANIGTGSGSMVLAGITVHKQVIGYRSNSGKSTGWRVSFNWIGSDGQKRHSETIPPEADNRRNDPDRNWGLYE